jgi:hypothetical protein
MAEPIENFIRFDDEPYGTEALICWCGNDPMDEGFDEWVTYACDGIHYACNTCNAEACVDYALRTVQPVSECEKALKGVAQ